MAEVERIDIVVSADDNASSVLSNVRSSLNSMYRGINMMNSGLRQYNSAMAGVNRMMINIVKETGAAIYDFTSDSINNFTELSEQHAKTLGAMANNYDKTIESQEKFFEHSEKLRQQAIDISKYGTVINGVQSGGSLVNATDVSAAQTALVKAGVDGESILNTDVLSTIIQFAVANQLETDDAVKFAVSLGSQFGYSYENWGEMLDKISHTADLAPIEVRDVVQSMKYAGGISAGLDRPMEETLAEIALLGNFGLAGSQAGSGIQALLTRILTGDTTVITQAQAAVAPPKALEAFYDFSNYAKSAGSAITYEDILNETFTETDITGQLRPMEEIVDTLGEVMADLNDEEQAWFAKKLFGLYQMKAAYGLINGDESQSNLSELIKEIELNSDGTNANKLNELLYSQSGQIQSTKNLIEGMKTELGQMLEPTTTAILGELQSFLKDPGNYNINWDRIRSALDDSCDAIEEMYGSAIADAVRNLGYLTIDLGQVVEQIAPEFLEGMLSVFNSAISGKIFGEDSVTSNWGDMIGNMHEALKDLPPELQELGEKVVDVIDFFGKLAAMNMVTTLAQLITSVMQIAMMTVHAASVVINGAGNLVTNNGTGGGGTGTGGGNNAGTTGAGAAGGAAGGGNPNQANTGGAGAAGVGAGINGSTVVGDIDEVAKVLGTTSDDAARLMGASLDDVMQALGVTADDVLSGTVVSLDDVARAFGTSVNDVAGTLSVSVDDVAKALGTTADDVASILGMTGDDVASAIVSVDDVARALGTTADDVAKSMSFTVDDIARALGTSIDDVAQVVSFSIDDIARGLGVSADDVIRTFGQQSAFTIDDIARALGTTSDDVISGFGASFDDIIKAGANSVDDVARGSSGLFSGLSRAGKALGVLGTIWQVAATSYEAAVDFSAGDNKGGWEAIAGGGSSLGGSMLGAEIGTAIAPGPGTIIGAIIGALGGDKIGREVASKVYDEFDYGTTGIGLYDDWRRQDRENDYIFENMKENAPDLVALAEALHDAKVGNLNTQEWALQLYHDNGYEYYDQRLNGNDRLAFQSIYTEMFSPEAWNQWKDRYEHQNEVITPDVIRELESQMVRIMKGDALYNSQYDPGNGSYEIWTGTQEELNTYLRNMGPVMVGTDYNYGKGAYNNPYMMDEMDKDTQDAIYEQYGTVTESIIDATASIDALNEAISGMASGQTMVSNVSDWANIIPGFYALSEKGQTEAIQAYLENEINITPSFSMEAPQVQVNVTVDGATGRVLAQSQNILNPNFNNTLNNWYQRVASQNGASPK